MILDKKEEAEVVCVGQVVLDCIVKGLAGAPQAGAMTLADSVTIFPGGDAFNESVILSRLGIASKIHCGLGHDMAGDLLLNQLKENHVDTRAVVVGEGEPSPVACLFVDDDGKRKSVNTPAHRLRFFFPDPACLKGAKVVSLASLFRAPFADPAVILRICRAAKAAGAILTADMKIGNLSQLELDDIAQALPYIDYLFPNETEAAFYTGREDYEEAAQVFLDAGVKNVIVKIGDGGCILKNEEYCLRVPAFSVPVADTTGAGDNFAAGFIASLIWGRDLEEALAFATGCAALCIGKVGATAGVESRSQVEAFLESRK
jgi:sugar/nucleoside kinase (ribokinase family)